MMIKIDKFATAVQNGYTEGQAEGLEMWSDTEFEIFMEEVSIQTLKKKEKVSVCVWQKSKFGNGKEWCRASDNPVLASDLRRNGGKAVMGGYSLSLNGDYINKSVCDI